jgi:anthranilate phosphoribosyltransferase
MGIPVDHPPAVVEKDVAAHRFGYLDIALYHPPVARLLGLRHELGVRNFVHPVARMLNPARAPVQIIGMTHPPYFEKIAEALGMLGISRALVVRGVEGEPELSIAAITKVTELRDGRPVTLNVHPKEAGLSFGTARDMAGFSPSERDKEASLLGRIIRGELKGVARDWVALNAGLLLYASRLAGSIAAGVVLAQRTIDSGSAAQKLAQLAQPVAAGTGASSRAKPGG